MGDGAGAGEGVGDGDGVVDDAGVEATGSPPPPPPEVGVDCIGALLVLRVERLVVSLAGASSMKL